MDDTIDLAVMVEGHARASARFHESRLGKDPAEAFVPLFESLSWAASIDERLGYPDVPELRGLRFARHRVHHQYADALWLDDSGAELPTTLPFTFLEWRWRAKLPPGRPSRDEEAYRAHLSGRPARRTLDSVSEYFTTLVPD